MSRFRLVLLFQFSFLIFHFFPQEKNFSGSLSTLAGAALPYTENSGDFVLGEAKAEGELSVYTEESYLYASGFLLYDALRNHADALDFVSGRENSGLSLKEAWFDYTEDFWAVRVGRQISAWGKADGLSVTDVLCPQDETQFAASTYAESRLGINAVRFSLKSGSYTLDAYCIPFFTPAALPLSEGSPLKKVIFGDAAFSKDDIILPEVAVKNCEYGAKFSAYWTLFDLSLYAFYGFDDEPLVSYSLSENKSLKLSGEYEKMLMFGADTAVPIGETVLRMEAAFFPERKFAVSAEKQIEAITQGMDSEDRIGRNQLKALAGIDWMPSSWTITAQYYADCVFGEIEKIERQNYEHCATLSVSRSLFNETLDVSVNGILSLKDFDSVIKGKAEYKLSDQITLNIEGDFFNKGKDGKAGSYGKFRDLSCLIIGGKFSF